MYADDRVLVAVLNRKRDLQILQNEGWYRIPYKRLPHGIYEEYIAFYLSGYASHTYPTRGIHLYARRIGVELCYRRDLIPQEDNHPRANEMYYRVKCANITDLQPPIVNARRRPIAFIFTTWDRFTHAVDIAELYSKAPHFVQRYTATTPT